MAKVFIAAVAVGAVVPAVDAVRSIDVVAEMEVEHNTTKGKSLDWSHMVTEAPDQGGHCNSCYIWAGIGCIESRYAIFTESKPRRLSTQQALDCMWKQHMSEVKQRNPKVRPFGYMGTFNGCDKGEPKAVLQYALDEGFMWDEDYPVPYVSKPPGRHEETPQCDRDAEVDQCENGYLCDKDSGKCKADAKTRDANFRSSRTAQCQVTEANLDKIAVHPKGKVKTFTNAGGRWEERAMAALETGPVAIGISAGSHSALMGNVVSGGGIATKDCGDRQQSHAVLLVGYGELDGKPYWKIRNSWGSQAYDNGYFKIPRGKDFCGAEQLGAYIEFSE